jgi:hypothetical protein
MRTNTRGRSKVLIADRNVNKLYSLALKTPASLERGAGKKRKISGPMRG